MAGNAAGRAVALNEHWRDVPARASLEVGTVKRFLLPLIPTDLTAGYASGVEVNQFGDELSFREGLYEGGRKLAGGKHLHEIGLVRVNEFSHTAEHLFKFCSSTPPCVN